MSVFQDAEDAIFGSPKDPTNQPSMQGVADLFKNVNHTESNLAAFIASTDTYADDAIVGTNEEGFRYKAVSSSPDLSNAAPQGFVVLGGNNVYPALAYNPAADGVTDDATQIDNMNVTGRVVDLGGKTYEYGGTFSASALFINGTIIDDSTTHNYALTVGTRTAAAASAVQSLSFDAFNEKPSQGYADVIPTSTNPVAAVRVSEDEIIVRTRTAAMSGLSDDTGVYFDEYTYRNPDGYSNVAGGWQLWSRRAYAKGRCINWLVGANDRGSMTNAEWAFRCGDINDTYVSGGEGPDWYYRGFGHGGAFNITANNQILLDGGGSNLDPIANWPVGTRKFGASFQFTQQFYIDHPNFTPSSATITGATQANPCVITATGHGYSTNDIIKISGVVGMTELNDVAYQISVVDVNTFSLQNVDSTAFTAYTSGGTAQKFIAKVQMTNLFDTNGRRDIADIESLVNDLGFNDSYFNMSPAVSRHYVDRIKPQGETAITLIGDGTQKGNWNTTTATKYQAYNSGDTDILQVVDLLYSQPIRQQGGGLAAWGLNDFGRVHVTDDPDFPKLRVFGASSEESLPRTAKAFPLGRIYEWQNRDRTEYAASGPS